MYIYIYSYTYTHIYVYIHTLMYPHPVHVCKLCMHVEIEGVRIWDVGNLVGLAWGLGFRVADNPQWDCNQLSSRPSFHPSLDYFHQKGSPPSTVPYKGGVNRVRIVKNRLDCCMERPYPVSCAIILPE